MKHIFAILFLLINFFNSLSAQSVLIKSDGTPVSNYRAIYKIGDNTGYAYAKALTGSKFALVDSTGVALTPFEYDYVDYVKEKEIIVLKKNQKIGFFDKKLKEIVPFKYDAYGTERLYDKNAIKVAVGKKDSLRWGVVSLKTGKEIVPCIYHYLKSGEGNFFVVRKDDKEGLLYCDKLILPIIHNRIEVWKGGVNEGISQISLDKSHGTGLIDSTGQFITPPSFERIEDFGINLAIVVKNYKYAFMNRSGKLVTPFIYDNRDIPGCIGEVGGAIGYRNDNYYYIDSTGVEVMTIDKELLDAYRRDTLSVFARNTENGVIYEFPALQPKPKRPYPSLSIESNAPDSVNKQYKYVSPSYGNYRIVNNGSGKVGVVDEQNQQLIPPNYDEIREINNCFILNKKQKYAIADHTGKILTPFDYSDVRPFRDSLFRVTKRNQADGLVNTQGELVLPCVYYNMKVMEKEQIIVLMAKGDSSFDLANLKTGRYMASADDIIKCTDNSLFIKRNYKWGLLDLKSGNYIIPQKYASLEKTQDNHIIAKLDLNEEERSMKWWEKIEKNIKYGLMDTKGNIVLPFEYYSIEPYYGNLLIGWK